MRQEKHPSPTQPRKPAAPRARPSARRQPETARQWEVDEDAVMPHLAAPGPLAWGVDEDEE